MMMLLVLTLLISFGHAKSESGYEACSPVEKPDVLNVHLVPHTHDDVGWLKTVDEYYYGSAKNITSVGVQYILDSVIPELMKNPERRFIYVEMAFFWRWWQQQDARMKRDVQQLVHQGRLEFINGGWSMNDEASTHYNAIIDQMSLGLKFLNDTFGECARPKIAWQIDPFGHSREQANIFARMGFDGLFFARLDFQEKALRMTEKTMEMIWQGRPNSEGSRLFTGALFNGYNPPKGFCFDEYCHDDPVMDDKRMHGYNVDQKVDAFIRSAERQAKSYATNHIIWTMGSDFNYNNAHTWFKNMDKLLHYVNTRHKNGSSHIHALYSTPSCYLKSLNDAGRVWMSKKDDFFPYASDPHAYWTGFFTSRPTLKGMVRRGNNFLQICKQLHAAIENPKVLGRLESDVNVMRRAMAVMQHHDAVTGTAKQAVTFDYAQRLHEGFQYCSVVISKAFAEQNRSRNNLSSEKMELKFCSLMNISSCPISENEDRFIVNIYNPLIRPVTKYVRLPITAVSGRNSTCYVILDDEGQQVPSQIVPIPRHVLLIPGRKSIAAHELVFKVFNLKPLAFRSYHLSKRVITDGDAIRDYGERNCSNLAKMYGISEKIGFENGVKLSLCSKGFINYLHYPPSSMNRPWTKVRLHQEFAWYAGHPGNNESPKDRASGAYIFRPTEDTPRTFDVSPASVKVYKGPVVHEVHQEVTPWLSQVIRVYNGDPDIEFEWLVGPIPVEEDKIGKEIVTIYKMDHINNDGIFYTDSNGRQMMRRKRNERPSWIPVIRERTAGNYYPINSRISIQDVRKGDTMTLMTDRSQGGSSIRDGSIEIMLHRRLLHDDGFGVEEALDERAYGQGLMVKGQHWLQYANKGNMYARRHRLKGEELFMQPLVTFINTEMSYQDWKMSQNVSDQKANSCQPPKTCPLNVHLLTLETWSGSNGTSEAKRIIIRFEHQFDIEEDSELSAPWKGTMSELLGKKFHWLSYSTTKIREVTLGGNLEVEKLSRLKWKMETNALPGDKDYDTGSPVEHNVNLPTANDYFELNPMEIRTFIIEQ